MATSKFSVFAGSEDEARDTFKTKALATAAAEKLRTKERVAVRVENAGGNTVLELEGPRTINMSKPFTRTVEVPEGVTLPEGHVARYRKARKGLITLHNPAAPKGEQWSILQEKGSKHLKARYANSRAAGRATVDA